MSRIMRPIFNFYSKLILLIVLFIIIPVRVEGNEGDDTTLGVCTKARKEENMDCTDQERIPATEYLQNSIFPFVPPYLKFFGGEQHKSTRIKRKGVPKEIQKYLKWADLRTKTPVLKNVLRSSGFTALSKNDKKSDYHWLGSWKIPKECKTPYQKVNSIPHYLQLDNKAKMWINVKSHGFEILGKENFDFLPETFILPSDMEDFKIAYNNSGNNLWLVKKPNTVWGRGMYLLRNNKDEFPKTWNKRISVVQKFIQNQYLINRRKIDVRFYVLTTGYNPLRVYVHNEYLVVRGRSNYTIKTADPCVLFYMYTDYYPEECSHIVNSEPTGSTIVSTKSELFKQMTTDGLDVERFEEKLHDGIVKLILTTLRPPENENSNYTRYNGFKLWGVDAVIDDHGNPIILEFNANPGTKLLKVDLQQDMLWCMTKTQLSETFNVVGFNLPPFMSTEDKESVMRSLNATCTTMETPAFDERLYQMTLSKDAKLKQEKYRSGSQDGSTSYRDSILDNLTPDDVRQLILAEDELSRSTKGFKRLYPTIGMKKYMPLSRFDPYYDMLFDAWETKYYLNRTDGIQRLQSLAQQKYHLQK